MKRTVTALLGAPVLATFALWLATGGLEASSSWRPVLLLACVVGIVVHKRVIAPSPFDSERRFSAFFYAALLHFLPAAACWAALILWVTRNMFPWLAGLWGQWCVLIGILVLVHVLVGVEFRNMRRSSDGQMS